MFTMFLITLFALCPLIIADGNIIFELEVVKIPFQKRDGKLPRFECEVYCTCQEQGQEKTTKTKITFTEEKRRREAKLTRNADATCELKSMYVYFLISPN